MESWDTRANEGRMRLREIKDIKTEELVQLGDKNLGWRDGLEVKSTGCSSRGPEFNSQQLHGGSQPSVMGSDALFFCLFVFCFLFFKTGYLCVALAVLELTL